METPHNKIDRLAKDRWFMDIAYEQALEAFQSKEVPVGACLVDEHENVLWKAFNCRETQNNSIGHAELICLYNAGQSKGSWRLTGSTLYVTLEPCIMCLGALSQARIKRVVFGAYDKKGGALSLGYSFHSDKRLNHQFQVLGGLEHYKCSQLLSNFFRQMRSGYFDS